MSIQILEWRQVVPIQYLEHNSYDVIEIHNYYWKSVTSQVLIKYTICAMRVRVDACVLLSLFAFVVAYFVSLRSNIEHGISEVCNLTYYRHMLYLQLHGLIIQTY